jgi:quinol monooxygenase YgiN
MIKITKVYHRPSADIPFHFQVMDSTQFRAVIENKRLSVDFVYSEDGLTGTIISVWTNIQDWDSHLNEPVCLAYWAARDTYNLANGITHDPAVLEEV